MDFGLSPDQIELRDAVRQMARRELAPGYLERAKSTEFPWEAYRQVARLGVLGRRAARATGGARVTGVAGTTSRRRCRR